jgi:hypothetical protein
MGHRIAESVMVLADFEPIPGGMLSTVWPSFRLSRPWFSDTIMLMTNHWQSSVSDAITHRFAVY